MNDLARNFDPARTPSIYRGGEFFLARQPILGRGQQLVAYELLFRGAAVGPANVTNDIFATASVISHASELGLHNVLGTSRGFINVDEEVLMSDFLRFLPKERVVLEILETVEAGDALIARIRELKCAGYVFALDDVVSDSANVQAFLPFADIVKLDITGMQEIELHRLSKRFKTSGKMLLAEKVENREQFETCLALGFDYFQGYYFAKPLVLKGRNIRPSQMVLMRLMSQLRANADMHELERSIKLDASLGLNLLRLAHLLVPQAPTRIDSIGQALQLLDRGRLYRWLQILLYAAPAQEGRRVEPLLMLATTRGRLLELIAEALQPDRHEIADIAFTVGIMSLVDALFDMPMASILEQIVVAGEVKQALLHRTGLYGDLLRLAEYTERLEECAALIEPLLERLQLSREILSALQLQAFEWSNAVADGAV